MKKVLRSIALFLALSCLLSATAFAVVGVEKPEHSFVAGEVLVAMKPEYSDVEDFSEFFPELDFVDIEFVFRFETGATIQINLTEKTHQAVLDAIEALKDNQYIREAYVNGIGYIAGFPSGDAPEFDFGFSFVPGEVIVDIKPEYNDTEDYKTLFPELDIDEISSVIEFDFGNSLCIVLKEKTRQAVVDAINALKDNPCVRNAYTNGYVQAAVKGDVNGDGEASNADIIAIARSIVGLVELTADQFKAADMDNDSSISNTDLVALAQSLVA